MAQCLGFAPVCILGQIRALLWSWGLKCDGTTDYAAFSNSLAYTEIYKKKCTRLRAYRPHAALWADFPTTDRQKLPRRTSAYTTSKNLLWFWWPGYYPIYWGMRKFCWSVDLKHFFAAHLGRRIRWQHSFLGHTQIEVKVRPRWGQIKLNFLAQHCIPKTYLSCPFLPQDYNNAICFGVRQLELPKIVLKKRPCLISKPLPSG